MCSAVYARAVHVSARACACACAVHMQCMHLDGLEHEGCHVRVCLEGGLERNGECTVLVDEGVLN